VPAEVTAGFNDAVMRQIHVRAPGMFVQIMAEPVVPVSIAIATIVAWHHELLVTVANIVALAIGSTGMTTGLALMLTPLTGWISWRLFRAFTSDSGYTATQLHSDTAVQGSASAEQLYR
jgi:hypothetical protein